MSALSFRRRFAIPCVLSSVLLLSCQAREHESFLPSFTASSEAHVAIVDLRNGAPESTEAGGFFPLPAAQTYVGLVRGLEKLGKDENVAGIFVRLGGQTYGFSRALELGESLNALRQAGKRVTCHAHQLDNATSALALLGCDETWVSAAGDVGTVGIAAEVTYLKGAMDKLGVEADMLAMGRYKSGAEALTREGPSEASAENLTQTLRDLREVWLSAAVRGRGDASAHLRRQLEDGPFTPDKAKALGLITHVGFEDEAIDATKNAAGTQKLEVAFGSGSKSSRGKGLADLVRSLAGSDASGGGRPRIAVVPAIGSITVSAGGPFADGGITSDSLVRTLKRLREDESVRAIVLRLDSPGGSPLASDLIWRQMMLTRKEKPVIVSIGGMAASGGYYIAAGGSKIVASESAIVGSIGVFGGKIVLGGALDQLGVKTHAFPASPEPGAGARALHLSPFTTWDDPTRERVRESMQRIYDLFVERVAEGRNLPKEQVYQTAEGAIFLAKTGRERGLVDELGGVTRAIELAREAAGLEPDVALTVEGPAESLFDALLLGSEPDADEIESALSRFEERVRASRAPFLDAAVFEQLRPFAAVLAPLFSGETVVAALPYAITIR